MKAIITASLALCGIALADGTLVWDMSFKGTEKFVTNANGESYTTLTVTGNGTIANGVITSPVGGKIQISDSAPTVKMKDSFSFVVQGVPTDVTTNPWPVLFGLGKDTSNNIKVVSNAGKWTPLPEGYSISDANPTDFATVETDSLQTFILTVDNSSPDSSSALTLYINGKLAVSATLSKTFADTDTLSTFSLGGRPYNTSNSSGAYFSNVQLYNGLLSASQIKSLSVPEPATLSLLALAGLVARRRRK